MASITKIVNGQIPSALRSQNWQTNLDSNDDGNPITEGDIFEIQASLGRVAKNLQIEMLGGATSASFRVNPYVTIFPRRPANEFAPGSDFYDFVASGLTYQDTSVSAMILDAGETWELEGELPVRAVEVVTMSGNFRLSVT